MTLRARPAGPSSPRYGADRLPSFRDLIATIAEQPALRLDDTGHLDNRDHADDAGAVGGGDSGCGSAGSVDADPVALVEAISGLGRLIGFARAMQQRYLAALARPGVVLAVDDLLDLAASRLCLGRAVPDVPAHTLAGDPDWGPALEQAAVKAASCEISCALRIAPQTARNRVEQARTMVADLPDTLTAQQHGRIDPYRASIIAERTTGLKPEDRHRVEQAVLPAAATRTPSRLRALLDREVIRTDPKAAAARERQVRRGRGTHIDPDVDGMARFTAIVGAPDAQVVHGVLDSIATATRAAGAADGRGQSQLRADIFTALFHDIATTGTFTLTTNKPDNPATSPGDTAVNTPDSPDTNPAADGPGEAPTTPAGGPADGPTIGGPDCVGRAGASGAPAGGPSRRRWTIPTCINVYVNAETLAGYDDEPAELAGHGIITADMARAIAQSANTIRTIRTTTNVRGAHDPGSGHSDDPSGHDPGGAHGDDPGGHDSGRRHGTDTRNRDSGLPDRGKPDGTGHDPGGHPSTNPGSSPASTGIHSSDSARSRTCGTVLDAGRTIYTPPKRLADYVTTRDRICRFPGCHQPARRCDIDHRTPYNDGGATCACNLDSLCRFHHLIKTFTPWHATPTGDGTDTLEWTTPTGHRYAAEPAHPLLDTGTDPRRQPAETPNTTTQTDDPPPF